MSKLLAVTGLSGKKSGGAFASEIKSHLFEIKQRFTLGIRNIARTTSDTYQLEKDIDCLTTVRGSFEDLDFLKSALAGVDTLVHIAGIHFSKKNCTSCSIL